MCQFYVCAITAPSTERASFEQNAPIYRRANAAEVSVFAAASVRGVAPDAEHGSGIQRFGVGVHRVVQPPQRRIGG